VRLYNRETKNLDVIAAKNIDEQLWKDHSHETGRRRGSYAWTVFESKQPLAICNIARDSAARRTFLQQQGIISFLGVPLIVKEETLGVLTLYSRMEREFRPEEIEFLSTVAGQAAIAIHNAQLYAELRKQAAALAKSNRIKDEFLSVVSHELRTPLSGIIGYTGLIRDKLIGPTTSKQNEALDKLMNRAKDLMAMISSILFATSIDADEVRVIRSKFSAVDLLNDLKTDYELPSQKTVAFRWDYPANLPALTTDREKLKSILQNLINNAVKFTPGGAISVEARMLGKTNGNGNGSKSGDFIEFKIADTGIGIPEAKLGVIFEKFRQVDGSETRLFGGVGLGLYIAKSFTELLEGDIKVKSKEGRGSIFTVKIPCGMDEEAEAQPGTGRDPRPEPKA
jgi:signal transduction histidine kinase